MGKKKPGQKYVRPYKKFKQYVPGWGGAAGRFIKMGQKYTSKGSVAHKALKLARKVADAVNVEYKHFDISVDGLSITNAGIMTNLCVPSQGSNDEQRIGDGLKMQHLKLKMVLRNNGTAQLTQARVIIIFDPQAKITGPSDYLQVTGTALAVQSPKDFDKRFQCQTLFDQSFSFDLISRFTGNLDLEIPINKHTQFEAGTTAINTGALRMILISDVAANQPYCTYYSRVLFTDN